MGGTPKSSIFMGFPIQKNIYTKLQVLSDACCTLVNVELQTWTSAGRICGPWKQHRRTGSQCDQIGLFVVVLRISTEHFTLVPRVSSAGILSQQALWFELCLRMSQRTLLLSTPRPHRPSLAYCMARLPCEHLTFSFISPAENPCVSKTKLWGSVGFSLSLSLKGMAQKLEHEEHSAVLLAATPDIGEH